MNNTRRKQISDLLSKLNEMKSELKTIQNDEQKYFNNVPENQQDSVRYYNSESILTQLDEACFLL